MRPLIEMISTGRAIGRETSLSRERTGTGKDSSRKLCMRSRRVRIAQTMITVNMGGLSETLFESELFGHVKGAFTDAKTDRAGRFELADESTLFMDEIANIPG